MAKREVNAAFGSLKELLSGDADFVREAVREYLQDVLEEEMTAALGAAKGERSMVRLGYRSGYYERALVTRVGRLELRVPQDRDGRFSTALFERYQRSEKALLSALVEMYVQGVSTRKVKKITEELCGYRFSASTISNIVKRLDAQLLAFARRRLDEPFPYVIVDARYEKVRDNGVIASQAVLIALGIDGEGRRQVLAVELANRESTSSWKGFSSQPQGARPVGRRVRRLRRSPGSQEGDRRSPSRGGLAALLRALSQKCPGPHAEKTRRRLPAGTALALRPAAISARRGAIWRPG